MAITRWLQEPGPVNSDLGSAFENNLTWLNSERPDGFMNCLDSSQFGLDSQVHSLCPGHVMPALLRSSVSKRDTTRLSPLTLGENWKQNKTKLFFITYQVICSKRWLGQREQWHSGLLMKKKSCKSDPRDSKASHRFVGVFQMIWGWWWSLYTSFQFSKMFLLW